MVDFRDFLRHALRVILRVEPLRFRLRCQAARSRNPNAARIKCVFTHLESGEKSVIECDIAKSFYRYNRLNTIQNQMYSSETVDLQDNYQSSKEVKAQKKSKLEKSQRSKKVNARKNIRKRMDQSFILLQIPLSP